MSRVRRKLGEILQGWGLVTDDQITNALKVAEGSRKRIGEVLIELDFVSESDVAKALANQFNMEYIDLDQPDAISKDNLKELPEDVIKKYLVLPLEKENGKLKVLIHDPMDLDLLDDLTFRMNCRIETALGSRGRIKEYIEKFMSGTVAEIQATIDATIDKSQDSMDIQGLSIDGMMSIDHEGENQAMLDAQQAPIIKLVNKIIHDAVVSRVSDIHIEPFADRVRLRYRIDGRCVEQDRIPKSTQAAVIARVKIMSGMKIQEKRIPQDGRIKLRVGEEGIDFRVSACPTYHGESIVLRILRPESARIGLENLGMRADTKNTFEQIITRPNGIFLVTGPTGSGKTTTLYTALDVLNRPDKKIITAEDPVEYNFKGINQCQVNEDIGLTFSRILRAMLRQAPNIVLVGEIRDREVGEVAIQAALTGHLVFSTLHTNDAPSALTRLIDMGIKPFLVASSIQAVLAQRLVRILCENCKEVDEAPDPRTMKICGFKPSDIEGKTIYRAVGCSQCSGTGYRGRRGIYELMIMNTELRELAFKRSPVNLIRGAAMASGMRNLIGDGRLKVLDGGTTIDESARTAQVEGIVDLGDDD